MYNFLLFFFLGTAAWGSSLFLIKNLLIYISPLEIAAFRIFLGCITLWILVFIFKKNIRIIKFEVIKTSFVLGIFNLALPFFLISYGEQVISVSVSAIINASTPLITSFLAIMMKIKEENFRFTEFFCIILGLIGVLIIYLSQCNWTGLNLYFIALIGSCFCYSIAALYTRVHKNNAHPLLLSAFASTWASAAMLIVVLIKVSDFQYTHTLFFWSSLVWLGVISSGIATIIYIHLIQNWGAVRASTVTYLMTLTGVILGFTFLDETLSVYMIIGSFFLLLSLIILNGIMPHISRLSSFILKKSNEQ